MQREDVPSICLIFWLYSATVGNSLYVRKKEQMWICCKIIVFFFSIVYSRKEVLAFVLDISQASQKCQELSTRFEDKCGRDWSLQKISDRERGDAVSTWKREALMLSRQETLSWPHSRKTLTWSSHPPKAWSPSVTWHKPVENQTKIFPFFFFLMWVNSGEIWNQNILNRWSFWSRPAPVQLQALISPDSWEFAACLYSFVWEKCKPKDSPLSPTTCWVTEHRYSHIHIFDCWLFMRCCRHLCLFSWVPCCVVLLLSVSQ